MTYRDILDHLYRDTNISRQYLKFEYIHIFISHCQCQSLILAKAVARAGGPVTGQRGGDPVLDETDGTGAPQALSWSWELDFAALMDSLNEPGPHDPTGPGAAPSGAGRSPAPVSPAPAGPASTGPASADASSTAAGPAGPASAGPDPAGHGPAGTPSAGPDSASPPSAGPASAAVASAGPAVAGVASGALVRVVRLGRVRSPVS